MEYIENISIKGFRNSNCDITMDLNPDVNFIIGRNGTGKTTFINLINAGLSSDIKQLCETYFEEMSFRLSDKDGTKITIINKSDTENIISYKITYSSNKKEKSFDFPVGIWSQMSFFETRTSKSPQKRMPRNIISPLAQNILFENNLNEESNETLSSFLANKIQITWLSVHRASISSDEKNKKYEFLVDRKLYHVAQGFSAYFSVLDKTASEETDSFQQAYLLSLISPPPLNKILPIPSIDIKKEKENMRGVLSEFKINTKTLERKLDSFSKRLSSAIKRQKEDSDSPRLSADDFLVLTDLARIQEIVKDWHKLQNERNDIYKPKEEFTTIINELFFRKTLEISLGNEPIFRDMNSSQLDISHLSSGEKQMFIILGETLLQKQSKCIFMADEPELSLHIDWQEKLVPSIKRINPNVQVIFATHSPDIVGAYNDAEHVFNLEKVI